MMYLQKEDRAKKTGNTKRSCGSSVYQMENLSNSTVIQGMFREYRGQPLTPMKKLWNKVEGKVEELEGVTSKAISDCIIEYMDDREADLWDESTQNDPTVFDFMHAGVKATNEIYLYIKNDFCGELSGKEGAALMEMAYRVVQASSEFYDSSKQEDSGGHVNTVISVTRKKGRQSFEIGYSRAHGSHAGSKTQLCERSTKEIQSCLMDIKKDTVITILSEMAAMIMAEPVLKAAGQLILDHIKGIEELKL